MRVQKEHSSVLFRCNCYSLPSNKSPIPPKILPSSLEDPGMYCPIREASLANVNDCTQIVPGPSNVAKKIPSPPNNAVFTLPTYSIS